MPTPAVSSSASPTTKASSTPAAPSASERFRERLVPDRPRDARKERALLNPHGALVPAPDGSFVVMPAFMHHSPARGADSGLKAHGLGAGRASLDQVRIGAGRDETRLHVRLADGPFAGVEIRGVQRGAHVAIEVVQDPARAPVDLDELRRALAARGIRAVDLGFADAHDAPRKSPQPPWSDEDDAPPEGAPRACPAVRDDEL